MLPKKSHISTWNKKGARKGHSPPKKEESLHSTKRVEVSAILSYV